MIKSIELINFKVHKHSIINFNENLSIITGENNTGKTSLLEAFLIFEECYHFTKSQIKTSKHRHIKNKILKINDFTFNERFLSHFKSVRSKDYSEVFYQNSNSITITITFQINNISFQISFEIKKGRNGTVYNIIPRIDDNTLQILNNLNNINFFNFIKSSPISSILQNEFFLPPMQIEQELSKGNNLNVMRNRLNNLNPQTLQNIQNQIALILGYKSFEFKIAYDVNQDLYIQALFRIDGASYYQDLALLGSGALQLIEVLVSSGLSSNYQQKVILLDEPDSHLHRLAQRRLVDTLRQTTSNSIQIILTTHNEQLVANAQSGELLHLYNDPIKMEVHPIVANFKSGRGKGFIQNNSTNKVYESLGVSASAMKFLEAIESDVIVFVEGKSDAEYLEALQHKRESLPFVNPSRKKVTFWSLGSITDLPNKLSYWKDILTPIKNKQSLWEKSILLVDLDFTSIVEMEALKKEVEKEYNIEMIYWQSYTIESILLEDIQLFCQSVSNLFDIDLNSLSQFVLNELSKIDINNFSNSISGQRKQREITYSIFKNKVLKLNDGNNYNQYMASLENSNRLASLLYNKEDIDKLLKSIFNQYNINTELSSDEIILGLIESIDMKYWQSYWSDILEKIYG